jgi:nicotinate-nucleotide--dimethylbenzimidazole phosphoribosyltransferase
MVEQVAELGGFEIVAMAGFFMQAARQQVPVILDGFVATAAALIAEGLQPGVKQILVASHLSAEPAHRYLLNQLGLQPYLEWNMRLGEGTGALLLLPMLDAASAICREMGTLEDLMKRIATGNSGDAQ